MDSVTKIPHRIPTSRSSGFSSRKNEETEVGRKFNTMICIRNEDPDRDKSLLQEYDHYEPYDDIKVYNQEAFRAKYGDRERSYTSVYVVITDLEGKNPRNYVAAKRIPSELDELERYCPCLSCDSLPINPTKYLFCTSCTGCLKYSPETQQRRDINISIARNRRELITRGDNRRLIEKLKDVSRVRIYEVLSIMMIIIIAIALRQ